MRGAFGVERRHNRAYWCRSIAGVGKRHARNQRSQQRSAGRSHHPEELRIAGRTYFAIAHSMLPLMLAPACFVITPPPPPLPMDQVPASVTIDPAAVICSLSKLGLNVALIVMVSPGAFIVTEFVNRP